MLILDLFNHTLNNQVLNCTPCVYVMYKLVFNIIVIFSATIEFMF